MHLKEMTEIAFISERLDQLNIGTPNDTPGTGDLGSNNETEEMYLAGSLNTTNDAAKDTKEEKEAETANVTAENVSPPADGMTVTVGKPFRWLFSSATGKGLKDTVKSSVKAGEIFTKIIILAIVSIFIFTVFQLVREGIDRMLLAEKLIEKRLEIALIAEQTDLSIRKDNDWEQAHEHYTDNIMVSMELLDRVDMTYAAVFSGNLQNLSARSPSYEGSPFEPNGYPEYVKAVMENENGDLVVPFTPPGSQKRDMYLHYQWMPSDQSLQYRVLAVIAISKYTVNTRISTLVQITAILLIITTLVIAIFIWRRRMAVSINRELEKTVRQRTAELEQQTANAKKASMAKSDFLSNMSHEMRTPMNAIIGMTTIAKNSDDIVRKDYCLSKIEDASSHLLSVINDILDMSKIEANKFELSNEKFNFEKMLQKVSSVIVFRVDEKQQNFSVHIDKNIPVQLIGDDQRIMQIVTNLLSNAVKFTPVGGSIHVNTLLLEEKDNTCTIKMTVTDTGIGISREQQERLFNSFTQAENSTTRKFGGTGLGLAISKHLVEMMNGEIWIESEPGKGSTFIFTIKLEKTAEIDDTLYASGVNWANMSVLVVDDAQETREYFVEVMRRFGSRCDVAASGEEACDLIHKHGSYNLCFIDWNMDGMDGIELAKRIKAEEDNKSIIIMISSSKWSDLEGAAKEAGITRFLPKPIFPSTIADCINECLGTDNVIPEGGRITNEGLFRGRRIILAEDVEVNREIVNILLEPTGLTIDMAENGLVAVELFKENPDSYDVIFMDVQMPEMDGYEAARKIRALDFEKAKQIPIIAMTANVFREDIERCFECGMNEHIGKPIDYTKMISKLCGYLFTKGNSAEAASG